MNQWNDVEEKIRKISEKESVPEGLSPENMKQKLKIKEVEWKTKKQPKFKKATYLRWGSVAVAFVLVFAVSLSLLSRHSQITKGNTTKTEDMVSNNEKTEELVEKIPGSESYDVIYQKINGIQKEKYGGDKNFFENVVDAILPSETNDLKSDATIDEDINEGMGDMGIAEDSQELYVDSQSATTTGKEHSTTNLQEEGVGEADIVITDGDYLYIQRQNSSEIAIVKVDGLQMETVSEIDAGAFDGDKERYLHEFYVNQDKLYLLTTEYLYEENTCQEETVIITYDISDRSKPVEAGRLTQSGSYHSSRMTGGYLYVFSDHFVYENVIKDNPESYVPLVQGEAIACRDICIPEHVDDCQYKVITSMALDDPTRFVQEKAVLCGSGIVYVSTENIYFTSYDYNNEDSEYNQTEIWKFAYRDGQIVGSATGVVKGEITDQFALSESNGYLRVVTTYEKIEKTTIGDAVKGAVQEFFSTAEVAVTSTENQKNGLYVLDGELAQVGAIEELAPGEQIYSARFFANTAYFVTFRQTDPLFSVDLSDPANPKLLGELKIPGFSEYLHPYGDGLLLGLGYDADADGSQTGIKLSMFDVSDPSNVKEVATKVIVDFNSGDSDYSRANCNAMYDHKKVLIDVEKNMIGFQVEKIDENYINGYFQRNDRNNYVVYGYDTENGFYEKMQDGYTSMRGYNVTEEQEAMNDKKEGEIRGAYIGQYLYVVHRNFEIRVYDMDNDFALAGAYEY